MGRLKIPLYRLVRRNAPREGTIKYWTNASGAAVILFIVPSACAFYIRYLGVEDREPSWVTTAYAIWHVHGALALLTILLQLIEKPRHVRFVSTEADLVEWPEEESKPPGTAPAEKDGLG